MAAQDDADDAFAKIMAKIIVHEVSEAKRDGKSGLLWVKFHQKPEFKKKFKNIPTMKDSEQLLCRINQTLKVECQANCDSWQWAPSNSPIFASCHDPKWLWLSPRWNGALEKNRVTLEQVLMHQAPAKDEGVEPTWHWQALSFPSCKVSIKMGIQCLQRLLELIPFDDVYFPLDMQRLNYYLKIHLRHRLMENHTKLYSKHVAWFGCVPTADDPPQPFYILINTQLLSKHDRQANLLLLCVLNTSHDQFEKPWFAVRVVLSSELNNAVNMRDHLRRGVKEIDQIPDKDLMLVNHDNKVIVPDVLTMRSEDMMFDASAYPQRIEFGDFVRHMREEARGGRIPPEFDDLSDDGLRSRAMWAIERARDFPNIAVVQWFCDKNSKQGYPQLVLPMTLDPYPTLTPRLGLVLQACTNEGGIISYKVLTALSLAMVYNNMLVCQPRGCHWLTMHLPAIQVRNLGQPEELGEDDSTDEVNVDNIWGPVV